MHIHHKMENMLISGKAALIFAVAAMATSVTVAADLAEGFRNPPPSARPHTWWHWMNGNVSKEGITADLEAMAAAGIAGAHVFDAGLGIPPGPVLFNTPVWTDHLRHAAKEARRLGIELILSNASGWSCSGGPWIAPSNSMKAVVHSETEVKGGARFRGPLPLPEKTHGFYEDIAILAVPAHGAQTPLGDAAGEKEFPADKPAVLEFRLSAPVPATALQIAFRADWCGNNKALVRVETSDDGAAWKNAGELELATAIDSIQVTGVQRLPFPEKAVAANWRLTIDPRTPKYVKTFYLSHLALLERAVVANYEGRTYYLRDGNPAKAYPAKGPVLKPGEALDITKSLDRKTGVFDWTAPAGGDWRILRIGYASNGKKNHPTSMYGLGLEVDKLSRAALDFHFEQYVGKVCREFGELAGHGPGIAGVLVDSYEVGSGNWTQGMEAEFVRRKGYRLEPFLPVFAGYVVGSDEETDSFLRDFRDVVAALFQENFAGGFQENCRKNGLEFYLEPYGNCPPNAFDYGRFCDVPMGEFWLSERALLQVGLQRWVSGTGRYWGKRTIGAEAFTESHGVCKWGVPYGRWTTVPWDCKIQADLAFTEGVNKMIFHRFTHQPWAADKTYFPGMTMGQWGTHFDRTNTWWPYMKDWCGYLSRCQFLLQEGRPFADALVYLGDGLPMAIEPYWDRLVPYGYDSDMTGTAGLAAATVRDGKVVSPVGNEYATLIVPEKPLVRPDAIAALKRLVDAGVKPVTRKAYEADLPPPDFRYSGTTSLVSHVHRIYDDGTHGYFVGYFDRLNPADLELSFRITGLTPELWDPMTGCRHRAEWTRRGGRTVVKWHAEVGDSVFVMMRPSASSALSAKMRTDGGEPVALKGEWRLRLPDGAERKLDRFVSWSEIDDDRFRYFSGTATYLFEGEFADSSGRLVLDLGEVRDIAEVKVNGRVYPALWKPPFRLDITEALNGRKLKLEIKVTNTWVNRLIGDERLFADDCTWKKNGGIAELPDFVKRGEKPPSGRTTFTTWKFWQKDDRLFPAGILGPVTLRTLPVGGCVRYG